MKILVNTGPAHPLFFPVVPLAWALHAAGHQVLVAAPDSFEPVIRGAGLRMAPVSGPLDMGDVMGRDRNGNPLKVPDTDEEMADGVGSGFARLATRTLEGTRDLVGAWRPDLVVTESYSFGAAALAAAAHGVPWAKHTVGPGDLPIVPAVARELAPEIKESGLDELPAPDLVLDNCPPLMGGPADGNVPIRYVPYGEPGLVPGWSLRPRSTPRVLVTLGSVQPQIGGLPALGEMLRAVAELPVELVVAVADHLLPQLGGLPTNVVAAGWQSLTAVLPGCDLAVHHGGPGTMMACSSHGLPQVVVPGRGKPLAEIRRLTEHGGAVEVPPADLTPEALREACRTLLDDPERRERALAVRDDIAAQPSPLRAVSVLEDLVTA
ncbi:nucleotide disphospho-sugar-binding domain-containing protein [Streptomyces sp. NPDC046862]|uniref:nucleotide disphospho-sugar-binding domain-containing protein n=1 Tax=Streptomyces sp. NPDC046862 TaxID=3154603 RepID=UPI0034560D43